MKPSQMLSSFTGAYCSLLWFHLLTWSRNEATRRNLKFDLDLATSPKMVVGDAKKIRTVVANLTANAGVLCLDYWLLTPDCYASQIHERGYNYCFMP